ncbi:putative bacteriophage protein [Escherichia coli TA464]|nr:putative bacteriophage protein [Escherichia coli TA464]
MRQQSGFCVYGSKLWEAALIDFSKLIRELRLMISQLPNWKFLLVWSIPFLWVVSQLIVAIKG